MGPCRSLGRQQAPMGDGFTSRVCKGLNPSRRDAPRQLWAPVHGRAHPALCRLSMPEILWLQPRVRHVTPRRAESRQPVDEPHLRNDKADPQVYFPLRRGRKLSSRGVRSPCGLGGGRGS